MELSGFTFVHNANEGGYPLKEAIEAVDSCVDEMVVVDMASTDGTKEWLLAQARKSVRFRVLDGKWVPGGGSHLCLGEAYAMNRACHHEMILHFEADEVFDPKLAEYIRYLTSIAKTPGSLPGGFSVYRLQVEQNFQRIRWYPEPVHRVFQRGATIKQGHTSNRAGGARVLGQGFGYLWDVTNCFRDNWIGRRRLHTELWGPAPARHVPLHFLHPTDLPGDEVAKFLAEPLWEWRNTPLALPPNLAPLVGRTKYELD